MKATLMLSEPLDQPERLKCTCGCDHFKINLEAKHVAGTTGIINSVECQDCHEIFCVLVRLEA